MAPTFSEIRPTAILLRVRMSVRRGRCLRPDEGRRTFDAEKSDLAVEDAGQILAAAVVAQREPLGDALADCAKPVADVLGLPPLPQRRPRNAAASADLSGVAKLLVKPHPAKTPSCVHVPRHAPGRSAVDLMDGACRPQLHSRNNIINLKAMNSQKPTHERSQKSERMSPNPTHYIDISMWIFLDQFGVRTPERTSRNNRPFPGWPLGMLHPG